MDRNAFTLDEEELPDVSVRSTPLPDDDLGRSNRRSLNGVWRFAAGPRDHPSGDEGDWRRHDVPGQWNLEGYDVDDGERGWYRREFTVPPAWESGRVKLRFDAAYSDAVVRVNGRRVAEHVGGYTPFEADVTDAVRTGEGNALEVGVAETSAADETSQAGYGGGITRDVTLFRVPACHLSDLDVETSLARDGSEATVRAGATLENAGDDVADASVRIALTDPNGDRVEVVDRDVGSVAAGSDRRIDVEVDLDEFEAWNPERPRLYELSCELQADGERERITERVGVRQVEVDGNRLLLNGRPVTLRGINWRECDPDRGIAISAEATRRDAERLRAANVNYVRTGHHPPSTPFVEACDELGIVVEMESPVAFLRFDAAHRADDPADREVVCRQALEIVERDKNRPSVCLWSLSNESAWGSNFEAAARLVSAADPTRPITFNWGKYRDDDAPFCDVANHHYPTLRDSTVDFERFDDHDRPVLFDEFAHTYCYNGSELNTDPGLRDDYVRVLERAWDRVRDLDACAGAAIWAGLDHLIPEYRWGIVDKYRRTRPEYWHVKKVYAPVKLERYEWRDDGTVRAEIENRCEFVNLSERRIEWRAGGESGTLAADAPPGATAAVDVPVPAAATELSLSVRHPSGFTIDEFRLEREEPPEGSPTEDTASPTIDETDRGVRLETDAATVTVAANGSLDVSVDGETVLSGLPGLAVTPNQSDVSVPPEYGGTIASRLNPWRCESVSVTDDGDGIEIRGGYYYDTLDKARGTFALHPRAGGALDVEYDFTLSEEHSAREVGVALPVVQSCETLSWTREGRWTTYPADHVGRRSGTARAFPGGRPPDDSGDLDRTRPWAREATPRGSNDFRSTKRNVYGASLTDDDGRGVRVQSDGTQHVRCAVRDDAVDLFVLDRSLAGVGLALLDRSALLDEEPTLEAGTRLQGTATIRVHGDE